MFNNSDSSTTQPTTPNPVVPPVTPNVTPSVTPVVTPSVTPAAPVTSTAAPPITPSISPAQPNASISPTPAMSTTPAQPATAPTTPPTGKSSSKLLFIVSAVALVIGLAVVGYLYMNKPAPAPVRPTPAPVQEEPTVTPEATPDTTDADGTEPVACPMDAKVCADGSSVGRSGPNCEFAACPGEEDTTIQESTPEASPADTTDINTDTTLAQ